MFARFQDIKNGALEGEGAINNVEAALSRVTLASGEQMSIMNRQTGEFKDFSEVIEQLSTRWDSLNEMEQANIVKAFAGVRQRESFLALMENQETMHYLLAEAIGAEGLAADRFSIYLEGLEAAQNKATAAWEGMVQATIEGDLVKTFYEASASVSEFITSLGGLDTVLIGVAAGLIVYGLAATGATTATGLLSAAFVVLYDIVSANPFAIAAIAVALATIEIVKFNKASDDYSATISKTWAERMQKTADATHDSAVVVDEYAKALKNLSDTYEQLSWFEKMFVDNRKVAEEGLRATIAVLGDTAESYDEYVSAVKAAAAMSGYLVDEQGRLYKEVSHSSGVTRKYLDSVDSASEGMIEAKTATDGWMSGLRDLREEVVSVSSGTDEMSRTFESFLNTTEELSKGDAGISGLLEDFSQLEEFFKEGLLSPDEYFAQMSEGLSSLDMGDTFGSNQEAASVFFTGLVENSAESLSLINEQWSKGETSFTQYTDSLASVGEMFVRIGEMSEQFLGTDNVVSEAISQITDGVNSLSQAQEMNVIVQDTMRQATEESLQFGTEAYNKQMGRVADAMAASGIMYTTTSDIALSSANDIYGYLTQASGNFQILAGQSANATGGMMQTVVNGAGAMLGQLASMIDSFNAQIHFTPSISGGSIIGALLGTDVPPTLTIDVGANVSVSKASNIDAPVVRLTSGLGEIAPPKISMTDMLRDYAEELKAWSPSVGAQDYGEGIFGDTTQNTYKSAANEAEKYANTVGSITDAYNKATAASKGSGAAAEKAAKDAVKALEEEKKARLDALKEQLDAYKDLIDARKKLLDTMQEELDYQRKLSDKQSSLSRIQSEIEELRLDDSEEAQARRRALEEEASEIQIDIAESQVDRQIEIQKDALDAEYENFKRYIEWQMAAIENPASAGAMPLALPTYHSGGIVGSSGSGSGEVVARLLSGELVSSQSDMETFINKTLPSMLGTTVEMRGDMGAFSIGNLIELTVQGNLDTSVMPEIDAIADRAIQKINDIMQKRGLTRTANQFSI